jgi:hypothetical protein
MTLLIIVTVALLSMCGRQPGKSAMADRGFSVARLPGLCHHRDGGLRRALPADPDAGVYSFNSGKSMAVWGGFRWTGIAKAWANERSRTRRCGR